MHCGISSFPAPQIETTPLLTARNFTDSICSCIFTSRNLSLHYYSLTKTLSIHLLQRINRIMADEHENVVARVGNQAIRLFFRHPYLCIFTQHGD